MKLLVTVVQVSKPQACSGGIWAEMAGKWRKRNPYGTWTVKGSGLSWSAEEPACALALRHATRSAAVRQRLGRRRSGRTGARRVQGGGPPQQIIDHPTGGRVQLGQSGVDVAAL